MREMNELFAALERSSFRRRFRLRERELVYLREHGLDGVLEHARRFVNQRLGPARPANEGRQTPWKGHPVFVAQHGTATCCRGCLSRWHGIEPGRPLSGRQVSYVLRVIERWLRRERRRGEVQGVAYQRPLFGEGDDPAGEDGGDERRDAEEG